MTLVCAGRSGREQHQRFRCGPRFGRLFNLLTSVELSNQPTGTRAYPLVVTTASVRQVSEVVLHFVVIGFQMSAVKSYVIQTTKSQF